MATRLLFTALVMLVAVQRLLEVRKSTSHAESILARGGREHAAWQIPLFKLLHTTWLISACAEVWLLSPAFRPWLATVCLVAFVAGQLLRLAAMRALGRRWTIREITVPRVPPVVGGIYRYLRHPNYVGVILEVASLPLIHSAFYTATVFSVANALLLVSRIRAEEAALEADNNYFEHLGSRSRFLPAGSRDHGAP